MFIPLRDDNPLSRIPFQYVTVALIAASTGIFLFQITAPSPEGVVYSLGLIPAVLFGQAELAPELYLVPSWATLFTSMFLHGGWFHLIGNMLFLWIFGDNIEDSMGHGRFIVFYLLCGLAAAFAQAGVNPASEVPMIGASGAISGVLGAYLVLHPHKGIWMLFWWLVFVRTFRLPAFVVLGFWIGLQVLSAAVTADQEAGVAWWAHIAGFVAGALLIVPFRHPSVPLFDRLRRGPWGS
jgi:membrane associated rhomboid family serine protease